MRQVGHESGEASAKAWLRRELRQSRGGARLIVLFGLAGTVLAIGQAWCAALVLGNALGGDAGGTGLALAAFAVLALLRAAMSVAGDRAAFDAGAAARRRLRSDALSRLLH